MEKIELDNMIRWSIVILMQVIAILCYWKVFGTFGLYMAIGFTVLTYLSMILILVDREH